MNVNPKLYNKIRKIIQLNETPDGISFLMVSARIDELKRSGAYTSDEIDNILNVVLAQE